MKALSATEAIGPALARTRRILFQPFRFSTFLKLCFVAAVTEGMGFRGFNSGRGSHGGRRWSGGPVTWTPEHIALAIGVALLLLVIGLFVLYLIVRLRFALFESLARQSTLLRPGWRMYREQSWRFFWLSVVVGIGFVVVAAGAILPFVRPIVHVIRDSQAAGHLLIGPLLSAVLPLVGVLLGLTLLAIAIDVILRDFMLPHMALEDESAGEAWLEVWDRLTSETGAFLVYGVLRVLMPIGAAVGIFIVLAIPLIVLFGIPGVMLGLLHAAAMNAQGVLQLLYYGFEALLVVVLVALGMLVAIGIGGPLGIAIREYALMFYGGRYQRLGDVLAPPPAVPPSEAAGLA